MTKISDFFSLRNSVLKISSEEQSQTLNHLESVKAFARTTYKSIYVIDYAKKGFEYVSENPLFLCGHSQEEVTAMGYAFYLKYVIPKDLEMLVKINTVGFDFYDNIPIKERKNHTITYDFHLKNQEGKIVLVNQKLTPLFLTQDDKIWKAICIISLSNANESGNIKIYRKGDNKVFCYDLNKNYWFSQERIVLSEREKEVLLLSSRGFTIKEVGEAMRVSPETVKFHRKKLFDKLEVANISEAIVHATNNKLI